MDFESLKQILLEEDNVEREQRIEGHNINDQNLPFEKVKIPKMPEGDFFSDGNIYINKHHRYSAMPDHTHEFVELNYMLSGSCTQYVDGKKIELKEREILLMDKDIVQSIDELGENDILINILIKDDSITTAIIVNLAKSKGVVNEFLLNASSEYRNHDSFLYFRCANKVEVQEAMSRMIIEYYSKDNYYMRAMNLLLSLLLINLSRVVEEDSLEKHQESDDNILEILRYIESHYTELNLNGLSSKFGYNPNYMSDKLKRETGYSFKNLINNMRYQAALSLMRETDKTFSDISYEIGFSSTPSLYKLIAKYTNKTPKELKERTMRKK
ncbi:AraC family transcriptional regulator [Dellaglioa algida]|uniref:AraC family transcriptional regulator n=1 Tax=Dellaglioa algida TaxID=105612 RepID=UPI0024C4BC6B|nr:helix-turn-helix domain-containing protein [Dellaglioa algida]MDK1727990.1 helix-turn-helix domain-containing protein [Dellaglioa algida]MDK1737321.1 helix-turn-helix domain-containing protein [Dellaglioa algida]